MNRSLYLVFIATLFAFGSPRDVDVEIDFDFDPCLKCEIGEKCKIAHNKLLELPVAMCVKEAPPQDTSCVSYSVSTNILNCKTKNEWVKMGHRKCNSSGKSLKFHKVNHICHNTEIKRYLLSQFTCCQIASGDTPTVVTNTPPATTNDATSTVNSNTHVTYSSVTTISGEETLQGNLATDSVIDENITSGADMIYLIIFVGIFIVVAMGVVTVYVIMRRRKVHFERNKQSNPTVIINPHCDDYKFVFEEYSPAPKSFTNYVPS